MVQWCSKRVRHHAEVPNTPPLRQCADSNAPETKDWPAEVPHPVAWDADEDETRCTYHRRQYDLWMERERSAERRRGTKPGAREPEPYVKIPRPKRYAGVELTRDETHAVDGALADVAMARAGLDIAARNGATKVDAGTLRTLLDALDELANALAPLRGWRQR